MRTLPHACHDRASVCQYRTYSIKWEAQWYLNGSTSSDTAFYRDIASSGLQDLFDCISPLDSYDGVPIISQGGSVLTGKSCRGELQ